MTVLTKYTDLAALVPDVDGVKFTQVLCHKSIRMQQGRTGWAAVINEINYIYQFSALSSDISFRK